MATVEHMIKRKRQAPDPIEWILIHDALERRIAETPGRIVSISSPSLGPLAGFVPDCQTGEPIRLTLADKFFDDYRKSMQ